MNILDDQRFKAMVGSLFLASLFALAFILMQVMTSQGLFGLQDNGPLVLAFDINSPFINYGLAIITSSIVHTDTSHLLLNTAILIIFGPRVEKALGRSIYLTFFLFLHLVSLLVLTLTFGIGLEHSIFVSGASAAILGILSFSLLIQGKFKTNILAFILIAGASIQTATPDYISLIGHLTGLATGTITYLIWKSVHQKMNPNI